MSNPVADQLRQHLPGMSEHDAERFAASITTPGPYAPTEPRDDVPRGTLTAGSCPPGSVYPGVPHRYQLYRSAGLAGEAALIVFMDGERYLGPEANAAAVLDQLGLPCVALFIEPGAEGPGLPIYGGTGNRSVEYDLPGDAFSRFLVDELIPHALEGVKLGPDRALVGLSSGGHCALNAAWERPDYFNLVASHCGSFVNLRGGHELAGKIRRDDTRRLKKVFLQSGEHDLDIVFGHWPSANRDMAAALTYRGIPHRLVIGEGGHSLMHGGSLLRSTLRWLFE
jgi:enterochelin esterase family protein